MKVFLSYRRGDASGHTGRLHDDLVERLGPGSVFQDVSSIGPGQRFLDAIETSIGQADVVFAVIGRHWTGRDEHDARPGISDEHDVVRRELEIALRSGRRIVPVLVDHAVLPAPGMLPPSLAPLLDLNAVEVRDEAWPSDLDRLYAAIGVPPRRRSRGRPGWLRPAVVAAAVVLVIAGVLLVRDLGGGGGEGDANPPTAVPVPAEPAQPQPPDPSASTTLEDSSGRVGWTVQRWWQVALADGGSSVTVQVKVANDTDDTVTVYRELFALRAGQVDQGVPDLAISSGNADGAPGAGEAVIALVRFARVLDATPLVLLVGTDADTQQIVLAR